MKLRLQPNSIRLRLKRNEVGQLITLGRVEEQIAFGRGNGDALTYILETSPDVAGLTATLKSGEIRVRVSVEIARRWASSDEVGMEAVQATGGDNPLRLLIEKDFACLNGSEEQNVDTFPNPLAGTRC